MARQVQGSDRRLRLGRPAVLNGGGSQMPMGGPFLNDAEKCTLINWVKGAAS